MQELGFASILFYIFLGDMSKFAAGFIAGVYVGTKFDVKPYVIWAETNVREQITRIQVDVEKQKEKIVQPPEPDSWISSWFKKPTNT